MDLRGTISRALSSKRSARVAIAYRNGDVITEHGEATGIFERAYGAENALNKERIDYEPGCYEVNSFIIKTCNGKVCGVGTLTCPKTVIDSNRDVVFLPNNVSICSAVFDQLDKIGEN